MRIEHWDEQRDGALTESALRRKLTDLGYRVYFLPHTHDAGMIDAVLSGRFQVAHSAAVVSLDAVRPA